MKDPIAGILGMLETGTPEQKVAAIQVLAWLKPKEDRVVRALKSITIEGEGFIKPYAIEALGMIGNNASLSALVPILHQEGPIRNHVIRALSKAGERAEKVLDAEYEKVDDTTKAAILEILAQSHGTVAIKRLLEVLKHPPNSFMAETVVDYLKRVLEDLSEEKEKDVFRKTFSQAMKKVPKNASPDYPRHLLELLAEIPSQDQRSLFISKMTKAHPPEVRRAALRGLAPLSLTPKQQDQVFNFLKEDDFLNVVGPALEILKDFQPNGSSHAGLLGKLLTHPHVDVRLFAIRQLGNFKTAASAKQLLPFLQVEDPKVRAQVSESLGGNREAIPGLLKILLQGRDLEEASRPLQALILAAKLLNRVQLKKVLTRFVQLLETGDPVQDYYRRILQESDGTIVAPLLSNEAHKLKQARKHVLALQVLMTIPARDGRIPDDIRYEIAINTLLAREEHPGFTEGDPVMGHITKLLESGFGIMAKLKKEKALQPKDALYIGTRLVEGLPAQRELGRQILERLIETDPECKEAIQASQRLKIEGLAG